MHISIQMNRPPYRRVSHGILALIAVLFGLVTIVAGTRVLAGADPGYVVFQPLLIYNTAMGFAYIGAGALAWLNLRQGRAGAFAIFLLNLLVLATISILYLQGGAVAIDSVRAMTFRTVVWLVLSAGLWWLARRTPAGEDPAMNT